MSSLTSFFKKKQKLSPALIQTDLHSHLLPGIDDGVQTMEEALAVLEVLEQQGYRHVVTTPHVMQELHPNTPAIIKASEAAVQQALHQHGNTITLSAAAEYYLDEYFLDLLKKPDELLLFGDAFLLFETPVSIRPVYLEQVIKELRALGITPVMAHPERMSYLQSDWKQTETLSAKGLLYQINLGSFCGYYRKEAQRMAEFMAAKGLISFLGSDCHKMPHTKLITKAFENRKIHQCLQYQLLNQQLSPHT